MQECKRNTYLRTRNSHIAEGCSPFTAMPPAAERVWQNARMATVHSTNSLCLAFLRISLPHGRLRQNRKRRHAGRRIVSVLFFACPASACSAAQLSVLGWRLERTRAAEGQSALAADVQYCSALLVLATS